MDCIFCKIISGEIPCYKIYEDKHTIAFLDISKDVNGHTLVMPKKHQKNILECDNKVFIRTLKVVKKISKHYVENCGYDGVNIINNNNKSANQSVFHLHFHIIPRKENDNLDIFVKNEKGDINLETLAEKLQLK